MHKLLYGGALWLVMLLLVACGNTGSSTGALSDETELAAIVEPTPVPASTFTPTPVPPPTEEPEAELAEDEPAEDEPAEIELLLPEPTAVPEEEENNGAEVDLSVLLVPTPTPSALDADAAPETETDTETATETDTETDTETSTEAGTETEAAAEAVSIAPNVVVSAEAINIRSGPGIAYDLVGAATLGEQFGVVGRNPAGDWWQVCCIGDQTGWIFGPLVTANNAENVAVAVDIPPLPTPDPVVLAETEPVALEVEPQPPVVEDQPAQEQPAEEPPAAAEPAPAEPAPAEPAPAAASSPGQPAPHSGTAGNFDPNAQYQIVHYRTLGFVDNNGGIFNRGGQQLIFLTVLDEGGNGVNGVVVKNAVADNLTVVTGDKGSGKTEIKMNWDPYKLFVAQDGSGPVTSQVSNQMNNPYPHIPDVVGMLGPVDNEYAICPTAEDRCSPPFYHAHWSYEITFQKVR